MCIYEYMKNHDTRSENVMDIVHMLVLYGLA